MEKYGRARQATDDNVIWRIRIVCWVTKATTGTHSEYVKPIAFPLQQWLCEGFSMSHLLAHFPSCYNVYCAVRTEFTNTIKKCYSCKG